MSKNCINYVCVVRYIYGCQFQLIFRENFYEEMEIIMPISICIITKNEVNNLEKCLRCASSYPFEIVVVDTGSTDNSVEVAKKYTDKVFFFEWCNDFSKAKNYAIECATNDLVMVLDTDEFITEADISVFEQLVKDNPNKVGRIERVNIFEKNKDRINNKERINRVFDRRLFHYVGSIHEQVCAKDGSDYATYLLPLSVRHTGYDGTPEERRNKSYRNISLLEEELKKKEDPYILYQLGKSHYMLDEYEKAIECFERATSFDLEPRLEYVEDMIITYGYALIKAGKPAVALSFEGIYKEFSYSCDFVFLMGMIYMENARFAEAIAEYIKATKYESCSAFGANSYMAYYNVGVIYECLGKTDEAVKYYKLCGEYENAKERLRLMNKG